MQTWTTIRDGVGQEQQPTDSPLSPPDSPWRYGSVRHVRPPTHVRWRQMVLGSLSPTGLSSP